MSSSTVELGEGIVTNTDAPTGESSAHGLSPIAGALVVLGVLLALLMGALDNFVVLTALSQIVEELGQPTSNLTFVIIAYLITSTIAIPIFAKLSDIYSRRNVFVAGLLIFIAGSALAGLSQNFTQLVIFRAVQGFGSGGFFPVGVAIVAVLFPPETRARIVGLLSGVFGIATVGGPFLGALIVDHTTWRWVFYVNIPIGVVGLTILLLLLPVLRPEVRGHFDAPGAALLSGWVGALMYALIEVSTPVSSGGWAWTDPRVIALLLSTGVLLVLFVVWELRARAPLVPLRLLGHRVVSASGGTTFLVGVVVFPLATFVTVYISAVIFGGGGNPADTVRDVLYFLVIPLVIGAALGGQLLTRIPYRPIVGLGLVVASIGMFLLTTVVAATPVWILAYGVFPVGGIAFALIWVGFGSGLTFPVFLLAVQNQVPIEHVGEASGLVQFLQSLGGAIGLTLLSSFQQYRFQALFPSEPAGGCPPAPIPTPACADYFQQIQNALVSSYAQVFLLMLVLLGVGLVFGMFLSGRLPKGTKPTTGGSA